jgi:hypothetical protein
VKVTCTVATPAAAHWRLVRGGHVYARGVTSGPTLRLGNLPAGRYQLHVAGVRTTTVAIGGAS